jgi:hypothetical protein
MKLAALPIEAAAPVAAIDFKKVLRFMRIPPYA